jgi:hypothetical protein
MEAKEKLIINETVCPKCGSSAKMYDWMPIATVPGRSALIRKYSTHQMQLARHVLLRCLGQDAPVEFPSQESPFSAGVLNYERNCYV